MSKRQAMLWCLIAGSVVLAAAVAGCGGSDGESELTKAEYLKRADAVCSRTDKQQEDALRAYAATLSKGEELTEASQEEKVVLKVGLPPLREQVEELRELPFPKGDEDKIEGIYEELETATQKAEANPGLMLNPSENPFNGVEKKARKYGFKVCGAA